MSFITDYENSQDQILRLRIMLAAKNAAIAIVGEATTSKPVVDQKRNDLGVTVLSTMNLTSALLETFAVAACLGDNVNTSSTDGQISTRISAIWNDIAGVSGADQA